MNRIIRGLRRWGEEFLGLDCMSGNFRMLALNYLFVMMYYTLESVFVNTLLYRITPEMSVVMRYRIIVFLSIALFSNIAAYLCQKWTPIRVIKLGGLAYITMYLLLFFGMDYMLYIRDLVAVLSGCGAGLYFGGHNTLLTHYTDKRNRGVGVSMLGLIQGLNTLLIPIISGFVISLMPGNTGYRCMFGLGMAVVLLQRRLQAKLVPIENKKHKSELRLALKLVWRKTTCKLMLAFDFFRGIRDGVFLFFLNMVLFQIITNESLVGVNTFLTGSTAIIGSWAYGKLAGPGKRVKLAFAAITTLFLCCLLLFRFISPTMIMAFSVINAFCNLFIMYTANTYSFDVMAQNETTRQCVAELNGMREATLSIGRVTGIVIVLLFPDTLTGYIQAMCLLTAIQYITLILMKLVKDILDRKQIRMSAHY